MSSCDLRNSTGSMQYGKFASLMYDSTVISPWSHAHRAVRHGHVAGTSQLRMATSQCPMWPRCSQHSLVGLHCILGTLQRRLVTSQGVEVTSQRRLVTSQGMEVTSQHA
eukprot:2764547-Rhodomonas_salina.2